MWVASCAVRTNATRSPVAGRYGASRGWGLGGVDLFFGNVGHGAFELRVTRVVGLDQLESCGIDRGVVLH